MNVPPLMITGGSVVNPQTGQSTPADLLLADGRVSAIAAPGELGPQPDGVEQIDADGLLVAPGLIDLQVNGAAGIDVTADPDQLWQVAAALPRHGVTAFLPTLVTTDERTRDRALATLQAGRPAGVAAGARPLGLHFEGPMLSPLRSGAHEKRLLREPSAELIAGWTAEAGVLMVTLAPELPGAVDVVRQLTERGVLVSLGHTAADLEQMRSAIAAGARAVTHLFNAMPGLDHREPGPVGAALGADGLVAGVIVDGLHVHPTTVQAAYRALGPHRFLAVSDTTAALDQPDGPSWLGGRPVVIGDGAVRLVDDGGLAGSAVGLDECLRLLAAYTGLAPAALLAAATTVPADLLGRAELGRLQPGSTADVVLFSPQLQPMITIVGGQVLHDWHSAPAPEWTVA
jgi:N-acetylglucosamine-6-phosphate deacetylase